MKITTNVCRDFVSSFISRNPSILCNFSDGGDDLKEVVKLASISKNWKRIAKFGPTAENDYYDGEDLDAYVDGATINSYGEPSSPKIIGNSEVVCIRVLDCSPFEGQLAFLVVETSDDIFLGRYVGD